MISKKISAISAVLVLTSCVVFANTANNVLDKTNEMEKTIYGHVQEGAIIDRVGQIELTVMGHESDGKLNSKVDHMFKVVEEDGTHASLKNKVDMIQWTYSGALTKGSLIERMNQLERSINGRVSTGTLEHRVDALESAVIGTDKKIVLQEATIPTSTVFTIHLNQPISSQTAKVGDKIGFTLAEDVIDGNLLVVPQGTEGVAVVTKVKKARSFGRQGELELSFGGITTVGGDTFTAEQGKEAKEKSRAKLEAAGASVAGVAILGPIGLVGGYFIKGKAVEITPEQDIYIQPEEVVNTYGAGLMINSKNDDKSSLNRASSKDANKGVTKGGEATSHSSMKEGNEVKRSHVKTVEQNNVKAPSQPIVIIKRTN